MLLLLYIAIVDRNIYFTLLYFTLLKLSVCFNRIWNSEQGEKKRANKL